MTNNGRLSRYGDWSTLRPLWVSGKLDNKRPFFAGADENLRMDLVRTAINEIRINWENYPAYMGELRELMSYKGNGGGPGAAQLEPLFQSRKQWHDAKAETSEADFSAIKLYTSDYGYRSMFSAINSAFRSDGLADDKIAMRAGTFLVELLTIDLYNYRATTPEVDNFVGRVYRGMAVGRKDFRRFQEMVARPVTERYIGIPLAMTSATLSREKALEFSIAEAGKLPGRHALLWDIKVEALDPQLLRAYQKKFPSSIVTSLCAVPISRLSEFEPEQEVLLRGPFFQVLGMRKEKIRGRKFQVVEAVMLNSNRDHLTAIASNIGADAEAREFFRAIVSLSRSRICAEYADTHGFGSDFMQYRAIVAQNEDILASLV